MRTTPHVLPPPWSALGATLLIPALAVPAWTAPPIQELFAPDEDVPEAFRTLAAQEVERRIASTLADPGSGRAWMAALGVADAEALRGATLGPGFQVHALGPVAAGTGVEDALAPTGVWRFLILGRQGPLGLVTVARMGGRPRVVETGAAPLARILWAAAQRQAGSGARSLRFIRVPAAGEDLLQVERPQASSTFERLSAGTGTIGEARVLALAGRKGGAR